ncbi:MAG: hypothetical protein MZV70_47680 [Desulfobacterales bacterium]|nr:hypothetical protein [Desulfobacterales bacterium]
MEIIKLQNGAYLINDTYNANPASVREALLTLKDAKECAQCIRVFRRYAGVGRGGAGNASQDRNASGDNLVQRRLFFKESLRRLPPPALWRADWRRNKSCF